VLFSKEMSMDLNALMGQVQNLIGQHAANQSDTGFNPGPLLNDVVQAFSQHAVSGQQTDSGGLLDQVKDLIGQHAANQSDTGFDPSQLLNEVEGLFNRHA
jgi:hypothetical protein